jgi:hypothetical protein
MVPPFDSTPVAFDSMSSTFRTQGAEIMLSTRLASLFIGWRALQGPDSLATTLAWPGGVVPYSQPHTVWSIAPMLGRVGGFGFYNRYMISDTKPFLKAAASLSYLRPIAHNHAHLQSDLSLNYWSARDKIAYGGDSSWNREIYDCSAHIGVQIKNFRLFYKMDNLLNRRLAYVPGYWMPGLTFRWGFSWIIPG